MLRRTIKLAQFFQKSQNNFIQVTKKQQPLVYKQQALFGFFSNLFLSKDQKELNNQIQLIYQANSTEKPILMQEYIKSKEQSNKKKDYDNYEYDQLVLAEFLMNAGLANESNAIINKFDKPPKQMSPEEFIARKLYINPQNANLLSVLQNALKNPTDMTSHSLPYAQMVLGIEQFLQKNFEKSEESLIKARDNIDVLLEHDKDSDSVGKKLFVKVLVNIQMMKLYFQLRNFEQYNKCLEAAVKAWEKIEDDHTSVMGYVINKVNPINIELIEMQIKLSEFFQDYSNAIDCYQQIIINHEEINKSNSLQLIQWKLRQLNSLIHENEFSDSKRLLKELLELIQEYQPNNNKLLAEYYMQEIHLLQKSEKLKEIDEKINKASEFCLTNKILDMSYARILLIYLRVNLEKDVPEMASIISSAEQLLKNLPDVPIYILADFYFYAAQYYQKLKDSEKISYYLSVCINLLKSPPAQQYAVVKAYYIWIGYFIELDLIEDAKKLRKNAQEYVDSIKLQNSKEEN